jgi:hypothetical protein
MLSEIGTTIVKRHGCDILENSCRGFSPFLLALILCKYTRRAFVAYRKLSKQESEPLIQHVMSNPFLLNSKLEATRSFYHAHKAARFLLHSAFLNIRRLLFCAYSSSSPNEAAATLKKSAISGIIKRKRETHPIHAGAFFPPRDTNDTHTHIYKLHGNKSAARERPPGEFRAVPRESGTALSKTARWRICRKTSVAHFGGYDFMRVSVLIWRLRCSCRRIPICTQNFGSP